MILIGYDRLHKKIAANLIKKTALNNRFSTDDH